MNYRKANISEIKILSELRKIQLIDEGDDPSIEIGEEVENFLKNKIEDGSLIEYVAEDNGKIVATGAVIFYDLPPSYTNKTGKRAYITNMYTKQEYRGQGIAGKLLTLLKEETQNAGITTMWLGASALGKPVYKKFGFIEDDSYMYMDL